MLPLATGRILRYPIYVDSLDTLRAQLEGRNLRDIAERANVGESWLRMWVRGEIPSPAYWRVQKITQFLAEEKSGAH